MSWCKINLVRGLVYSTKTRHRIYWGMMLYLVAAAGLLALTAGRATTDVKEGLELHRRANLIQKMFKADHPSATSMLNDADQMKQALLKNKKQIESVNTALPDKIQTMLPLMISLINQPGGSQLHKLKFTQQNRVGEPELEFSIRIPATQRGAANFMQQWKTDELLARQFTTITPANTQRGKIGAGDILIMSYKATFKE